MVPLYCESSQGRLYSRDGGGLGKGERERDPSGGKGRGEMGSEARGRMGGTKRGKGSKTVFIRA